MKTNNPIIDTMIDAQANAVNAWMDSAKKFQSAFASGNVLAESQSIYKDMMDKQAAMFAGMNGGAANPFMGQSARPEEFMKNWYNQQMAVLKQMTDFSQGIYNSMVNYGKNAGDLNNGFSTMNNAWTNIYTSWMNSMNMSYDTFSNTMTKRFNKDMFKDMLDGTQMFMKVQDMFQPMMTAIKNADFSMDTWKNIYAADNYKKITEQMFGSFFTNNNLKDVFENATKQMQNFFVSQNGLGKEYFEHMQNMASQFPEMFSGNSQQMQDLYARMNNVFGKTFEPLLKLVNPGKEKENVEATIELLDKVTAYSIKQSELQAQLYKTMKSSMEALAKETQEKYKDMAAGSFTLPTPQEMYNEWVKINEKAFAELFATEEFSQVKAEALTLTMEVKRHFQKQFEQVFEQYPVAFKSEMEEVYKTIHELKRTVKELQTKLAVQNASTVEIFEEEKAKFKKK